ANRMEDVQRAHRTVHAPRAVRRATGYTVTVAGANKARLSVDHQLVLSLQAHAHLFVRMLVLSDQRVRKLEVDERHHYLIAPDRADGDARKDRLGQALCRVQEGHGLILATARPSSPWPAVKVLADDPDL